MQLDLGPALFPATFSKAMQVLKGNFSLGLNIKIESFYHLKEDEVVVAVLAKARKVESLMSS